MCPFTDKEQNREYQREWARRKSIANQDGSRNIRSATITWAELTKVDKIVSGMKNWNDCVKQASSYVSSKKTDRMLLASLAIQSCKIRHGGDFKTAKYKSGAYGKTVKDFAHEIKIHHKTLHEWIRIKRFIVDVVSDRTLPFDYSAASAAMKSNWHTPTECFDTYNKIAGDIGFRNAELAVRYARNCRTTVIKYSKKLKESQKDLIIDACCEVLEILQ